MSLLLLVVTITVSFLVVRMGAIAFTVTGLEWSIAKFQALSCFSGTGFTTTEAELIVGDPQRRRIATILMILGNAGLVTMIATFANSLQPGFLTNVLDDTWIPNIVPAVLLPWVNITVVALTIYAIFKISANTELIAKITDPIQAFLLKKEIIERVSFQEIVVGSGGNGVVEITMELDSRLLGKALKDLDVDKKRVSVVALERDGEVRHRPPSTTVLQQNDKLLCFGKLSMIKDALCTEPKSS